MNIMKIPIFMMKWVEQYKSIMASGPVSQVILFSYSFQLSIEFQLLIEYKIQKKKNYLVCLKHAAVVLILLINDIWTLMGMYFSAYKCWNVNTCWHFSIYEQD